MWWILGTGIFFCVFQFQWIDPALALWWKIGAGVVFIGLFYWFRRVTLWKSVQQHRIEAIQLLEEYESRFGLGNLIRDAVGSAGSQAGEIYSAIAAENGDLIQTLIGHAIQYMSGTLARVTKTKKQKELEQKIQAVSDRIDAAERRATWSLALVVVSTVAIVWMSAVYSLPLHF